MNKINMKESVKKIVAERYPHAKAVLIDADEDFGMAWATMLMNTAVVQRLVFTKEDDGEIVLFQEEIGNWETIYRREYD